MVSLTDISHCMVFQDEHGRARQGAVKGNAYPLPVGWEAVPAPALDSMTARWQWLDWFNTLPRAIPYAVNRG